MLSITSVVNHRKKYTPLITDATSEKKSVFIASNSNTDMGMNNAFSIRNHLE